MVTSRFRCREAIATTVDVSSGSGRGAGSVSVRLSDPGSTAPALRCRPGTGGPRRDGRPGPPTAAHPRCPCRGCRIRRRRATAPRGLPGRPGLPCVPGLAGLARLPGRTARPACRACPSAWRCFLWPFAARTAAPAVPPSQDRHPSRAAGALAVPLPGRRCRGRPACRVLHGRDAHGRRRGRRSGDRAPAAAVGRPLGDAAPAGGGGPMTARDGRRCRQSVVPIGHAEVPLDPLDRTHLVRGDEAHHHPGGTGPGRPSRAVDVVLRVGRRIEVDHRVHAVHVDAPGGDVGGHQGVDRTADERVERLLPLLLAPVAVDGRGADPRAARAGGRSGRRRAWSGRTRWSDRLAVTTSAVRSTRSPDATRQKRCDGGAGVVLVDLDLVAGGSCW